MLIQQVDTLELEPLERAFDRLLDVVPAGCSVPAAPDAARVEIAIGIKTKLGRNHHPAAKRSQSFAEQFFNRGQGKGRILGDREWRQAMPGL